MAVRREIFDDAWEWGSCLLTESRRAACLRRLRARSRAEATTDTRSCDVVRSWMSSGSPGEYLRARRNPSASSWRASTTADAQGAAARTCCSTSMGLAVLGCTTTTSMARGSSQSARSVSATGRQAGGPVVQADGAWTWRMAATGLFRAGHSESRGRSSRARPVQARRMSVVGLMRCAARASRRCRSTGERSR